MRSFFFLFFFCLISRAYPQSCSCLEDYLFIKHHIETNHGGFNKKIKSPDEPAYRAFTQKLESEIKNLTSAKYCLVYLKKYIRYLEDHHSNISGVTSQQVDEKDSLQLAAFYKSQAYLQTELIPVDSGILTYPWNSERYLNHEGLYYTSDSSYLIALVKNKTAYRDYAAVILQSKTKLWKPGQVKFELIHVNDSLFQALISYRNHSIGIEDVAVKNGILQLNGWTKKERMNDPVIVKSPHLFSFSVLDSSTSLISIRSFEAGLTNRLDSFYNAIMPELTKRPKLIIDVRDNGGGSDASYKQLMPLIYTDPIESDVMEYFVTPENIAAYRRYDSLLVIRSPGSIPPFRNPIELMKKAAPYSFIFFGNGQPGTIQYRSQKGYPDKVAVVYNRNCASSCESFLFEVKKSRKTITVGENSGGFTGFGNVMTIGTPCGNTLSWTTTVFREKWKYEFIGISPQYPVPGTDKDWIEYAKKMMDK